MKKLLHPCYAVLFTAAVALLAAACSGGGGKAAPAPPTTVTQQTPATPTTDAFGFMKTGPAKLVNVLGNSKTACSATRNTASNPFYVSIPKGGLHCDQWVKVTSGDKTAWAQVGEAFDEVDVTAIMLSPDVASYLGGVKGQVTWDFDPNPPDGPWKKVTNPVG